jgi:transposase-like protein
MRAKVNLLPDEIKFQVVQEYLSGGFIQKELMEKYNIRGKQCINNWIRKFDGCKPTRKRPMRINPKESTKESLLELKIKKLEEDLKREQFRTKALNTMIDIAERELKVDIRKKSGAKR